MLVYYPSILLLLYWYTTTTTTLVHYSQTFPQRPPWVEDSGRNGEVRVSHDTCLLLLFLFRGAVLVDKNANFIM